MPSGFPATAWVYWLSGGILALLGLILLYWSLFRDRSRGRRRCPRCWYDMSATPQSAEKPGVFTCSECGKAINRERKLHTTRRRWRWAMMAILLVSLSFVGIRYPQIQRDGWWRLIPTTVLILLHPYVEIATSSTTSNSGFVTGGTANSDLFTKLLIDRISAAAVTDPKWCGLYSWQWWILLHHARSCEKNSPGAHRSLTAEAKNELYG